MKIGLVARADNTGLGMQTYEFYKHMAPAKTMVVDISMFNKNKQYPNRYPDGMFIYGFPSDEQIREFLTGLDVVFVAEAPYNFNLYTFAKEMGVKVAVQYNYEFFDWFANPHLPKPDMLIAPSKWHYEVIDEFARENNIAHTYLHCPVATEKLPFRQITQARTFLHIAGRSAAHDRNGTKLVIEASKHLKTAAKIIVHFQGEQGLGHQATTTLDEYKRLAWYEGGKRIVIREEDYPHYQDIYATGDVLLLPRRYGGNCLPLNEALSVGMPAIMTDISPNNQFLPQEWLVPAYVKDQFTPRTTIDIYDCKPELLAAKIDEFYNMDEYEMEHQNAKALDLASSISWESLGGQYYEALRALCTQ
jgi:glycosyltransferase involved in cell wall biosynthesis